MMDEEIKNVGKKMENRSVNEEMREAKESLLKLINERSKVIDARLEGSDA